MFGEVQPYSGHFYDAEWLEYDQANATHKPPRPIKVKGYSGIGVATGIREDIQVQSGGRWVSKSTLKIHTVTAFPYKIRDKIRMKNDEKIYIIMKVVDDFNHINSMANQKFPRLDNKPKILYLGE